MNDRTYRVRLWVVVTLSVVGLFVWLPQIGGADLRPDTTNELQVHFLDVGQGDATFIETPDGVQVLIDGGRDSAVLRELGKVMALNDRSIDVVVGTHPDLDHVGGLVDVFNRFDVGLILTTENEGESDAAAAYRDLVQAEGAEIIYARRGQEFALGASTTLRVLFPETNPKDMESNSSSIILQLIYGETEFLFTGDSPKRIEEYLVLAEGEHLNSDILKVGHHGSRTSTSELFLEEVAPTYAVISAEKDNRYGHPHVEVTDLLFNKRVKVFETSKQGMVSFVSDGKTLTVETE